MIGTRGSVALLAALILAAGCDQQLRPAPSDDWRLPVDESTTTIEAQPVLETAARTPIAVEELPAPDEAIGEIRSLLIGPGERLLALVPRESRVRVFARGGESLLGWGNPGREPGQLFLPTFLVALGERVAVIDPAATRASLWSYAGEHIEDFVSTTFRDLIEARGLDDARLVARVALEQQLQRQETLSVLSLEGEELARIALLPREAPESDHIFPRSSFDVAGETIFVTTGEAYQVHAFRADGEHLWALRVPWPRQPVTDEMIGRSMERSRRAGRAMGENVRGDRDLEFPDHLPAVARLAMDGRGRLFVFPYVENLDETNEYPVDVYDVDGRLLLNGTLPFQGWDASFDDEVFRFVNDAGTGTGRITRYRLTLPD